MINIVSIITKYIKVFLLFDLLVIFFCLIQKDSIWLLNTQISFFSVVVIVFGSFLGYHKNISKQINNFDTDTKTSLDNDSIDKLEDPYDLYSEDGIQKDIELSTEEFVKIVKEEKGKLKQNTIENTLKSASGFASIYRIIGYLILIFGFFYLNNNGYLNAVAYIIGISIVPISILATSLIKKN